VGLGLFFGVLIWFDLKELGLAWRGGLGGMTSLWLEIYLECAWGGLGRVGEGEDIWLPIFFGVGAGKGVRACLGSVGRDFFFWASRI
jgi:hypothetical protein